MKTFRGIQALQGAAALVVAIGHVVTAKLGMGLSPEAIDTVTRITTCGVDIFFAISGFIITTTAIETGARLGRIGCLEFAWRRFVRVYPVYWIVLAASVLIFPVIHDDLPGPRLKLNAWLLTDRDNLYVQQAWTLTFEVCFYLAVSLAILAAPRRIYLLVFGALAAVLALNLVAAQELALLHMQMLEFGLGALVAWLASRGWRITPLIGLGVAACLFLVAAYAILRGGQMVGWRRILTFGLGGAALLLASVSAELRGARFPNWSVYLGGISYSFYIWHVLVFAVLAALTPAGEFPAAVCWLAWLIIGIAFSAASYELLERPILRGYRDLLVTAPIKPSPLRELA
jgi:peptidoglycan/LPS O-acetylase OafA/YrhL